MIYNIFFRVMTGLCVVAIACAFVASGMWAERIFRVPIHDVLLLLIMGFGISFGVFMLPILIPTLSIDFSEKSVKGE